MMDIFLRVWQRRRIPSFVRRHRSGRTRVSFWKVLVKMAFPVFPGEGLPVHGRDQGFTEDISQQMRVPDRLRVGSGPAGEEARGSNDEPHPAYSMHVPDRLSLIEAPDMSPRPMFSTPAKHSSQTHTGVRWDSPHAYIRDSLQSPLRRSYSDHAFGRSPPATPTLSKQVLHAPPLKSGGRPPQRSDPPPAPPGPPALQPSLLSPKSMLQAARTLGQQASHHLLQTVTQKYSSRFGSPGLHPPLAAEAPPHMEPSRRSAVELWLSPEEEGGGDVEIMVLRRQVLKMSRRLAALERQNLEHRQAELLLFSLLASACLLNGWLWLRR
ncbi:mitochondrial fission factor-like isoform X1 [Anguilla rostrata]|uniref:mitochondrial fission factor-like isoform X1 n=2 Tax=Anguilla rostrata TaxID=7938 RepID=UPI0030D01271